MLPMKEFISRWFKELMVAAVIIYAIILYALYWATDDLSFSIIVTLVIMLADLAVLAYIYRDEVRRKLGR